MDHKTCDQLPSSSWTQQASNSDWKRQRDKKRKKKEDKTVEAVVNNNHNNNSNNNNKEVVETNNSSSNNSNSLQQQLNLSTEESGYESDLTRKSSSSDKVRKGVQTRSDKLFRQGQKSCSDKV